MNFCKFLRTALIAASLICGHPSASGQSHSESRTQKAAWVYDSEEFPNYLDLKRWDQPHSPLPERNMTQAEVKESTKLLSQALASVVKRLAVIRRNPKDGSLEVIKFFDALENQMRQVDPQARLGIPGGVLRALLRRQIYEKIRLGLMQKDPVSPRKTLQLIAQETREIGVNEFRNIGSDWDMFWTGDSSKNAQVKKTILEFFGNDRQNSGNFDSAIERLFSLGIDAKPHAEQTNLAASQGGSTLDWLTFFPSRKEFLSPERLPELADDFIRGKYDYLDPLPGFKPYSYQKQIIRAIRTPLESWLKLSPEGRARLTKDVDHLLVELKGGAALDPAALEQFTKMTMSASGGGSHNIYYRTQANSLESKINELIRTISSGTKAKHGLVFPQFVDSTNPDRRPQSKDQLKKIPKDALISIENLPGQTLYHGTKTLDGAIAICGGNFILSNHEQGHAYKGPGGNTAFDRATAEAYAGGPGKQGHVFELKIRKDRPVRIVEWSTISQQHSHLLKGAPAETLPFVWFAREYGVDIVLNSGIALVMNTEVLEFPSRDSLGKIIRDEYMRSTLQGPASNDLFSQVRHVLGQQDAYITAALLGARPEHDPSDLAKQVVQTLIKEYKNPDNNWERTEVVSRLRFFGSAERYRYIPGVDELALLAFRKEPNLAVREAATYLVARQSQTRPSLKKELFEAAIQQHNIEAIHTLGDEVFSDPAKSARLRDLFDPDLKLRDDHFKNSTESFGNSEHPGKHLLARTSIAMKNRVSGAREMFIDGYTRLPLATDERRSIVHHIDKSLIGERQWLDWTIEMGPKVLSSDSTAANFSEIQNLSERDILFIENNIHQVATGTAQIYLFRILFKYQRIREAHLAALEKYQSTSQIEGELKYRFHLKDRKIEDIPEIAKDFMVQVEKNLSSGTRQRVSTKEEQIERLIQQRVDISFDEASTQRRGQLARLFYELSEFAPWNPKYSQYFELTMYESRSAEAVKQFASRGQLPTEDAAKLVLKNNWLGHVAAEIRAECVSKQMDREILGISNAK